MPFDALSYLAANLDLLRAGFTASQAEQHYWTYGVNEGRTTTFDSLGYLASNSDLLAANYTTTTVIQHYLTYGYQESRSTTSFNVGAYVAANPDLMAYRNSTLAMQHYVTNGYRESRSTTYNFSSFDVGQYLASYPDLYAAFSGDQAQRTALALAHYQTYGIFEGRTVTVQTAAVVSTTPRVSDTSGSVNDSISRRGERDTYALTMNAGTQYTIAMRGSASSGGTLSDPYLRLYNSANTLLTYDDDSGTGYDSLIVYTPSTTGTYYLTAGAYADYGTGTYTLSVSRPTPPPTPVGPVLSVSDSLGTRGERDNFSVSLSAGRTYRFDMRGSGTNNGTLSDPYLRLYNSSGTLLSVDDDSGGNLNSRITYTPSSSGTYRLQAGAYADGYTGTYTLSGVAV